MSQTQVRTSWLQETLAGLATVSGVGYLATAYTISRWLTRGAPGRLPETPSDRGLGWEPLECRSGDGYRLAGWVVSPPGPRGTVVMFHGLRSNRQVLLVGLTAQRQPRTESTKLEVPVIPTEATRGAEGKHRLAVLVEVKVLEHGRARVDAPRAE